MSKVLESLAGKNPWLMTRLEFDTYVKYYRLEEVADSQEEAEALYRHHHQQEDPSKKSPLSP